MECPRCGYALLSADQACPRCATFAQAAAARQAAPAQPAAPATKRCPICHQPAVVSMPVCGRCGHSFAPPAITPPVMVAPPLAATAGAQRPIGLLAVVIAAVLLLLFIGGYALHASRRGTSGTGTVRAGGANLLAAQAVSADQIDQRLLNAHATTGGDLEMSLAWNTLTDLDLEVHDPTGAVVNFIEPRSASGGVLDVDANPTALTLEGAIRASEGGRPRPEDMLPIPESMIDSGENIRDSQHASGWERLLGGGDMAAQRFTRTPVEHIYYATAPKGIYGVYARCYGWREPNWIPLPFTVQVRSHGKIITQVSGTLGPQSFIADGIPPTLVCRFAMP